MLNLFNLKKVFVLSLLALSTFSYADCGDGKGIMVTGKAKVEALADTAILNFNAEKTDKNSKKARNEVEKQISSLINESKKLGIKDDEITSSNITLYPRYTYDKNGKQIFEGYIANREIIFKIKDFSLIDDITTIAVNSGITNVNGFSYELSNYDEINDKAAKDAIADANRQVKLLTEGFNVEIDKTCSLSFSTPRNVTVSPMLKMARVESANLMSSADDTEDYTPQKIVVESTVNATFSIK